MTSYTKSRRVKLDFHISAGCAGPFYAVRNMAISTDVTTITKIVVRELSTGAVTCRRCSTNAQPERGTTMTMAPERPLVDDQTSPGERMSARQRLKLVLVLGFLIALGPLTIDMYLPALPTITDDLQTTAAAVQLTLTGTLAGLALGQLLIGPGSEAIGRGKPLLIGVAVHILASILCVIAPNLAVLGTLRVLQGL